MSNLWCALFWTNGNPMGDTCHLIRRDLIPVMFKTKRECKEWIDEHYRYIRDRTDLRTGNHCWRLPKPVKVQVQVLTAPEYR